MGISLGKSNVRLDVLVDRRNSRRSLDRSEDEDVFRLQRLAFKSAGRVLVLVHDWVLESARPSLLSEVVVRQL